MVDEDARQEPHPLPAAETSLDVAEMLVGPDQLVACDHA